MEMIQVGFEADNQAIFLFFPERCRVQLYSYNLEQPTTLFLNLRPSVGATDPDDSASVPGEAAEMSSFRGSESRAKA